MILFAVSTLSYTDTRTIGWPCLITIPAFSAASAVAYDRFVCLSTWSKRTADFRSLALREYLLRHLWGRFFCFAQFDYSRYHSVLLNEGVKSLRMPSASFYNVASWSWCAHAVFRRARQHLENTLAHTAPGAASVRGCRGRRLRVLPDFGGISAGQKLERTLVLPMRLCRLNMPAPGLRE